MTDQGDDPPRPADLPPGYDEEDPYADVDLSAYPEWWQRNVECFRAHDLRPYRPSRLADDVIAYDLLEQLESEHGVDIRIRSVDPHEESPWELLVCGESVAQFGHVREPEGFTRYQIDADRVRERVRRAVSE